MLNMYSELRNIGKHSPEPSLYFLIQTLLPRGEKPNPLREKNRQINELMKEAVRDIDLCQVRELLDYLMYSIHVLFYIPLTTH